MIKDFFKYAFTNLAHRKVRSWLTMIGIFVGIASVVALVSLGQGLQQYIQDQASKLGTDKLIIQPKGAFGAPGSQGATELTDNDYNYIKDTTGLAASCRLVATGSIVQFDGSQIITTIYGVGPGKEYDLFKEAGDISIAQGRDLRESDTDKVVIGNDYSTQALFSKKIKLGDTLVINNQSLKVAGILAPIGNPSDDRVIMMNIDPLRTLFPSLGTRVDFMYLKVSDSAQINHMEETITTRLRKFRNEQVGQEDFVVTTPEQLLNTFLTVFDIVQAVIIGIAAISLIVGGIGIMNTMYTAVIERTKEIGIMKSIGARNGDILTLFMIESGTLGLVGGAIGIVIGMGIAKMIEFIATKYLGSDLLRAYFPWYLIVGALAFSFLVGVISGVVPAIQASRLKPVDALRYE